MEASLHKIEHGVVHRRRRLGNYVSCVWWLSISFFYFVSVWWPSSSFFFHFGLHWWFLSRKSYTPTKGYIASALSRWACKRHTTSFIFPTPPLVSGFSDVCLYPFSPVLLLVFFFFFVEETTMLFRLSSIVSTKLNFRSVDLLRRRRQFQNQKLLFGRLLYDQLWIVPK